MIAVITIEWIDFFMVMASSHKRHRCRANIFYSVRMNIFVFAYMVRFKNLHRCRIIVMLLHQKRHRGLEERLCWLYGVKWRDRHEDKKLLSYFYCIALHCNGRQADGQRSSVASVFLTHSSTNTSGCSDLFKFARGHKSQDTLIKSTANLHLSWIKKSIASHIYILIDWSCSTFESFFSVRACDQIACERRKKVTLTKPIFCDYETLFPNKMK